MENNLQNADAGRTVHTFNFPVEDQTHEGTARLDLGRRVEISFFSMGYRSLRDVRCRFRDGTLTLAGTTKTFYLKQVAQVIAAKVAGDNVLINNLIEVLPESANSTP